MVRVVGTHAAADRRRRPVEPALAPRQADRRRPTTPTRCGRCSATPTSRSSTAPRRSSRAAAWASDDVQDVEPDAGLRALPARAGPRQGTVEDFGLLVEATVRASAPSSPATGPARSSSTCGPPASARRSCSPRRCSRCCAAGRETGAGGWAETSLYDGMLATLGCMIGRSERAAPEIEGYWEKGSTFPNFLYRCADGELIQVWFGGKGMYATLLEVLGDEPSAEGYYADQMAGRLGERAARWVSFFAKQPRDVWIERLRDAGVACEPVLGPGEALSDPHLAEIGLADPALGGRPPTTSWSARRSRCSRSPRRRTPRRADECRRRPSGRAIGRPARRPARARLLGLRRRTARRPGPRRPRRRRDQGRAPGGRGHAGRRVRRRRLPAGKRSLALDINAPEARPVVERLLRWADVVLHNFRVGVSERLGIDEDDRRPPQPDAPSTATPAPSAPPARARSSRATTRSCRP